MSHKLSWFPWDVIRVETDEDWRLMSDEERGLYMRLLNHAWLNDGLPIDSEDLAGLIGVPLADKKWSRRVFRKFVEVDGRLVNPIQEQFREKAKDKSAKATFAVRTKNERKADEPIRASLSLSKSCSSSNSSSEVLQEELVLESPVASESASLVVAEEFGVAAWTQERWMAHPKKTDRKRSMTALKLRFARDGPARALFERNQELWIRTEKWSDKQGSFATKMWEFIESGEWLLPPPSEKSAMIFRDSFSDSDQQIQHHSDDEIDDFLQQRGTA